MKISDRRAKIVATIGPAIASPERLKLAILSGMNVARLNFSHGSHADHEKVIRWIRELSRELGAPVTLLQDLQGPKIRVGRFKNGSVNLVAGEKVTLSPDYDLGEGNLIPSDFEPLHESVQVGSRIMLDDGLMELKVLEIRGREVDAQVVFGGVLKDRKGMNLPGAKLPIACLTEKDLVDLEFGLKHAVDYVALSFVRRGSDILRLREIIEARRPGTKIVAKIEMLEALENLEEIVKLSDAVMVARGDLAVEVGQSHLPGLQKKIIRLCNQLSKPVITATQMLDSMVENPRPTRAEITDVANAVIDGTDALMLSAETASGAFPMECIRTMHEIAVEAEKTSDLYYAFDWESETYLETAQAIAASACLTAMKLDAKAIVCLTTSGKTATLISHYRPQAKVYAMTSQMEALNRLELVWGIQTFAIKPFKSSTEALQQIEEMLVRYGLVEAGDRIVVTLGLPIVERAKTNSVRVHEVVRKVDLARQEELPTRFKLM